MSCVEDTQETSLSINVSNLVNLCWANFEILNWEIFKKSYKMAVDTWPEIANDVISGRMVHGIKYDKCSKFEYPASNRFRVMFDLINTLQGCVSAGRQRYRQTTYLPKKIPKPPEVRLTCGFRHYVEDFGCKRFCPTEFLISPEIVYGGPKTPFWQRSKSI